MGCKRSHDREVMKEKWWKRCDEKDAMKEKWWNSNERTEKRPKNEIASNTMSV